ncbi:hypothetical protein ANOM_003378 [Aspergillus nomiae NRRL 13137]|uniref:Uncharacterized protein n=1 Tax=Aspergillus nomiae NRRL (strain ATCC 15546 / NRRL 13137 / CBS 260.88 / M93) TaxID=1509407 RepID=A0A0L1J9M0_ASPN3|nr:uncharacterized protein ANOM_003378 [Aspergillus nomiae NRRL 13137]KNG88138.1 hypothetical protein ANOM_003378 [Aspergillus nomiae NRRL 13137]
MASLKAKQQIISNYNTLAAPETSGIDSFVQYPTSLNVFPITTKHCISGSEWVYSVYTSSAMTKKIYRKGEAIALLNFWTGTVTPIAAFNTVAGYTEVKLLWSHGRTISVNVDAAPAAVSPTCWASSVEHWFSLNVHEIGLNSALTAKTTLSGIELSTLKSWTDISKLGSARAIGCYRTAVDLSLRDIKPLGAVSRCLSTRLGWEVIGA